MKKSWSSKPVEFRVVPWKMSFLMPTGLEQIRSCYTSWLTLNPCVFVFVAVVVVVVAAGVKGSQSDDCWIFGFGAIRTYLFNGLWKWFGRWKNQHTQADSECVSLGMARSFKWFQHYYPQNYLRKRWSDRHAHMFQIGVWNQLLQLNVWRFLIANCEPWRC